METTTVGRFERLRSNLGLLIFCSTAGVVALLWYVIMGIAWASDPAMFGYPVDWVQVLLMATVAPAISAPVVSGLAMGIAVLNQQKGCGFLIFLLFGLVIPIVALILVALGTAIARKFYIEPESEKVKEPSDEAVTEARRPAWSPQSRY